MSKVEDFRERFNADCGRLYELTGVPVSNGYYSLEKGYYRFDFSEPLGDDEIDEISRGYGARFFSMFNNVQAFIMMTGD